MTCSDASSILHARRIITGARRRSPPTLEADMRARWGCQYRSWRAALDAGWLDIASQSPTQLTSCSWQPSCELRG